MSRFTNYLRNPRVQNIISLSGGKDSTACYLLALRQGIPFRAVFCDTGHEHEWTLAYVKNLPAKTGGPPIEIIQADFSGRFERKRKTIRERWSLDGIPQSQIDSALEVLHPTGIPMLDLCMLKGRFPSTKARFCTEELKVLPMNRQVLFPAQRKGPVVAWQGLRRQESRARAALPRIDRHDTGATIWRPIFHWTHDQVFDLHRKMGVEPNPLYKSGMGRVGCFPCIMCQKSELREIARRFPEHVDRVEEWESIVRAVSRGRTSFFASDKAPYPPGYNPKSQGYYGIRDIVQWSKTTRGGVEYDLFDTEEPALCSSKYGLCE